MARVKVDTNYNSLADNILPVNLDTLYWRVYIYCDDYLKKQTDIPFSYHVDHNFESCNSKNN